MTSPNRWSSFLGRDERQLADVLVRKLRSVGLWDPLYEANLEILVHEHGQAVRRAAEGRRARSTRVRRLCEQAAAGHREIARRSAAGFFLIPQDRIHLAPLNAAGVDEELARAFDPSVPLAAPTRAEMAQAMRRIDEELQAPAEVLAKAPRRPRARRTAQASAAGRRRRPRFELPRQRRDTRRKDAT